MKTPDDDHRPRFVLDPETEHAVKNHVAVIVGFSELLLSQLPTEDCRRGDVEEIHRAARELMIIFRREARR
jgi:hypothetical protein